MPYHMCLNKYTSFLTLGVEWDKLVSENCELQSYKCSD